MIRIRQAGIVLAAMLGLAGAADANTINLVTNGGFEQTTSGNGQLGYNTNATGWTTSGYNFVFSPGTADTTGATGMDGLVKLWGPGTGSANGLAASPNGGNYIIADGGYDVGAITQSISGLQVGATYDLNFDYGGSQQYGFTGPTTEQWQVSLGGTTDYTPVLNDPSHGFTGWFTQDFYFVATSGTELLSFLAIGTPSGEPPMSMLDGVSLTQVPEPSSMALLAGFLILSGIGALAARRRRVR